MQQTLQERGAVVTPLAVYRRSLPTVDVAPVVAKVRAGEVSVVVCASGDTLANLKTLLSACWMELSVLPVVVVSERLAHLARELGFQQVHVANQASQDAIIDALRGFSMPNQINATTSRPAAKNQRWLIGLLLLVALLFGCGLLYALYQQRLEQVQVATRLANIETQANAHAGDLDTTAAMTDQLQQVQTKLAAVEQAMATLSAGSLVNQSSARVHEASDLVQKASDELQLADNVRLAVQLLQMADQRLATENDAKLVPIRKALANDIAALQAVPIIDVSGLYLKIVALNQQLDQLPLVNQQVLGEQAASPSQPAANSLAWWKQGLQQSWAGLQKIVVVQYSATNTPPLVTPQQQVFLYQSLHAMLENAAWAVLHQQSAVYQASLQQAIAWVKQYFVQSSEATQAALTSLQTLQRINVHPDTPATLSAMQAFKSYWDSTAST